MRARDAVKCAQGANAMCDDKSGHTGQTGIAVGCIGGVEFVASTNPQELSRS